MVAQIVLHHDDVCYFYSRMRSRGGMQLDGVLGDGCRRANECSDDGSDTASYTELY